MFLEYYKLREQPFGLTPDPRYLYLSPTHREALASLFYGIQAARGFLSLIAKPGMGKTTLLTALQERLQAKARFLFVSQTQCNSRELLRWLLRRIGEESDSQDLPEMQDKMTQFLAREASAGRRFVLVIDEAQNLDDSVLETVRLLSNCETPTTKLLQILLAGQPQLATKLVNPRLEQFRQRIGIASRIDPLSREETVRYIAHRLQVAGWPGGTLFSESALESIADLSRGIPRNINNLGFGALSLGYATGRKKIDANLIKEAAGDLDMGQLSEFRPTVSASVRAPAVISAASILSSSKVCKKSSEPVRRQLVAFAIAAVLLSAVAFTISAHLQRRSAAVAENVSSAHREEPKSKAPPVLRGKLEPVTISALTEAAEGFSASSSPTWAQATAESTTPGTLAQMRPTETLPYPGTHGNDPASAGKTVSILVQRGDWVQKICREHLGGDDRKVIDRLLALNPSIKDPDHLEVGQRINLPQLTQ